MFQHQLTGNYPGILIPLLIAPPAALPARGVGVNVPFLDCVVVFDLQQNWILSPLGAVLLKVAQSNRFLVKLIGHCVILG